MRYENRIARIVYGATADEGATENTPFVGMRPYEESEASFFFGRDEETQVLLEQCLVSQLTVLYASSGAGKTSIVRAGLIPALRANGATVIHTECASNVDSMNAAMAAIENVRCAESTDSRVLIFDQFERFLVFAQEAAGATDTDEPRGIERSATSAFFEALAQIQDRNTSTVLVMRREFVGVLDDFRDKHPLLLRERLAIASMPLKSILDAVVAVAEKAGHTWSKEFLTKLREELEGRATRPSRGHVDRPSYNLALMQLAAARAFSAAIRNRESDTADAKQLSRDGGFAGIRKISIRSVSTKVAFFDLPWARALCRELAPTASLRQSISIEDEVREDEGFLKRMVARWEAFRRRRLLLRWKSIGLVRETRCGRATVWDLPHDTVADIVHAAERQIEWRFVWWQMSVLLFFVAALSGAAFVFASEHKRESAEVEADDMGLAAVRPESASVFQATRMMSRLMDDDERREQRLHAIARSWNRDVGQLFRWHARLVRTECGSVGTLSRAGREAEGRGGLRDLELVVPLAMSGDTASTLRDDRVWRDYECGASVRFAKAWQTEYARLNLRTGAVPARRRASLTLRLSETGAVAVRVVAGEQRQHVDVNREVESSSHRGAEDTTRDIEELALTAAQSRFFATAIREGRPIGVPLIKDAAETALFERVGLVGRHPDGIRLSFHPIAASLYPLLNAESLQGAEEALLEYVLNRRTTPLPSAGVPMALEEGKGDRLQRLAEVQRALSSRLRANVVRAIRGGTSGTLYDGLEDLLQEEQRLARALARTSATSAAVGDPMLSLRLQSLLIAGARGHAPARDERVSLHEDLHSILRAYFALGGATASDVAFACATAGWPAPCVDLATGLGPIDSITEDRLLLVWLRTSLRPADAALQDALMAARESRATEVGTDGRVPLDGVLPEMDVAIWHAALRDDARDANQSRVAALLEGLTARARPRDGRFSDALEFLLRFAEGGSLERAVGLAKQEELHDLGVASAYMRLRNREAACQAMRRADVVDKAILGTFLLCDGQTDALVRLLAEGGPYADYARLVWTMEVGTLEREGLNDAELSLRAGLELPDTGSAVRESDLIWRSALLGAAGCASERRAACWDRVEALSRDLQGPHPFGGTGVECELAFYRWRSVGGSPRPEDVARLEACPAGYLERTVWAYLK